MDNGGVVEYIVVFFNFIKEVLVYVIVWRISIILCLVKLVSYKSINVRFYFCRVIRVMKFRMVVKVVKVG